MSTPGGPERRPVHGQHRQEAGGQARSPRPAPSPAAGKPRRAARRQGGGKGPASRSPPVKVSQGRNWGPIAGRRRRSSLVAVGIIGYGAFAVVQGLPSSWEERAADIDGIVDFRDSKDPELARRGHAQGRAR